MQPAFQIQGHPGGGPTGRAQSHTQPWPRQPGAPGSHCGHGWLAMGLSPPSPPSPGGHALGLALRHSGPPATLADSNGCCSALCDPSKALRHARSQEASGHSPFHNPLRHLGGFLSYYGLLFSESLSILTSVTDTSQAWWQCLSSRACSGG